MNYHKVYWAFYGVVFMDTPLLSIVIPVFNAEKYIGSLVETLAAAGIPGVELLLIDDGSSDGSFALARLYGEKYPFVRCFRQDNAGPAAARNRGIELAQGRYITFMDSDDTVDAEAFRKTVSLVEKYDAELWISDFHRVSDSGHVLDRVYQIPESDEPITDIGRMHEFLAAPDCVWNVWRCLFSREFLDANALRFIEGANIAEDLEFMVRALTCVKKPALFHNPYYNYRVNYSETLTRAYTQERVRQFTAMCLRAKETLDRADAPWVGALRDKLGREYVLNLAVCRQVPRGERAAALELCRASWSVLDGAGGGIVRLARAWERLFGLRLTSSALYGMKMLKRAARRIGGYGK